MKRISVSLLAALLAVPLVVGCEVDTTARSRPGTFDYATAPTGDGEIEVPSHLRSLVAEKSGLAFVAPRSWTVLSPDFLDDPERDDLVEKIADGMNLTSRQFRSLVRTIDIMAIGSSGRRSINVNSLRGLGEIPPAEALRSEFKTMNASVIEVEDVTTSLGDGRQVSYSQLVAGTVKVYGVGLFVETATGIANVTVAADDLGYATRLMAEIRPLLRNAGTSDEPGGL